MLAFALLSYNYLLSFYFVVCRLWFEVFFQFRVVVRNIGFDLLSRRDISIKLSSCNILKMFCLISNLFLVNSKLLRSCSRLMVAPDEL